MVQKIKWNKITLNHKRITSWLQALHCPWHCSWHFVGSCCCPLRSEMMLIFILWGWVIQVAPCPNKYRLACSRKRWPPPSRQWPQIFGLVISWSCWCFLSALRLRSNKYPHRNCKFSIFHPVRLKRNVFPRPSSQLCWAPYLTPQLNGWLCRHTFTSKLSFCLNP